LEAAEDAVKPLGVTIDQLRANPEGKVWTYPDREVIRFYERTGFATPTGKAEIYNTTFEKLGYEPLPVYIEPKTDIAFDGLTVNDYPLICVNGIKSILYTHTQFRTLSYLNSVLPEPRVCIHPEKAEELNITGGEMVIIETPQGQVKLAAEVSYETTDPNLIFIPYGWGQDYAGGPVTNHISPDHPRDPVTGSTANHNFRCRIRKCREGVTFD
jgi:anaerobic selenocysteine-containing dehydrogenase